MVSLEAHSFFDLSDFAPNSTPDAPAECGLGPASEPAALDAHGEHVHRGASRVLTSRFQRAAEDNHVVVAS